MLRRDRGGVRLPVELGGAHRGCRPQPGRCAGSGVCLGADDLSRRRPGGRFTYGLGRSSVLAALTNAVLLLLACGAIAWEAVGRIAAPPPVAGATVMAVAAVGIVLNGVSAWLLHGGSHEDLNRRSAFIHMLGDAAVSAGVLISGGLIVFTGWNWLDPAVSLLIVAVILVSTWGLLRDSVHLSLDGVPAGVNSGAVMSFLAGQRGVTDVHDLHIWALSPRASRSPRIWSCPTGPRTKPCSDSHAGASRKDFASIMQPCRSSVTAAITGCVGRRGFDVERGRTRRVGAAVYGSSGQ